MKITAARLSLFPIFFILYELSGNLSTDMNLPAFLQMAKDFATTPNHIQIIITTWLLGESCSQFFLGPLSDRFGRRGVLFSGGVLFLLATSTCALSGTLWILIIARFFQGIGVASIMITGYASIHELYDDRRATIILTWTSSAAVVSPMIGPLLGSSVLLFTSWRGIFWVIFIAALFALMFLFVLLPESLKKENRQSLHPYAIGKTYWKILKSRDFLLLSLSFGLLYSGMISWITASPIIIMDIYKFTPSFFGYLQIPVFAGFIVGAQSVRFFLKVISREKLIFLGICVSICGALLMLLASLFWSQQLYGVLGSMVIYALGFGLCAAPLFQEGLSAAEEGKGMVTAMFFLLMSATGSLISLLISILPDYPYVISIIQCAIIILSFVLFISKNKLKVNY